MTAPTTDIGTREDLTHLMWTFYERMFQDEVMGPIFINIAKMDLDTHIPIFCDFWEMQLFQKPGYRGGMMMVHFQLNKKIKLEHHHFMRWMDYWVSTVDDLYAGPHATLAKTIAARMARNISQRLDEVNGRATPPMASQMRLRD